MSPLEFAGSLPIPPQTKWSLEVAGLSSLCPDDHSSDSPSRAHVLRIASKVREILLEQRGGYLDRTSR